MSGSYIYDVVWRGLEMIENKQKNIICCYKLQFITFINAKRLKSLNLVNNVSLTCLPERIAFIFKFFNRNK